MTAAVAMPRNRAQTVVAVDARTLTQTGKGVPRFLAETLRELAKLPEFRFTLLSNRPLHPAHGLEIETIIDSAWQRVPGSAWLMARFNRLAIDVGAQVTWGPAHVLPPRHPRLKSVLTVHDLVHRIMPESMSGWNRIISKMLVEPSIHRADRIVADSNATRDDTMALVRPTRSAVDVVYLGVTREGAAPAPGNPSDENYLFSLGSIEPRKNIDGLIACFERLRGLRPDLTLRLTGAHSWGASETLDAIRRSGFCRLTGFLSDSELVEQLRHSRAFIMPSHYEGFGLPIVEAVGLAPIIASDIPVFRELGRFMDGIHFVDFADADVAARRIADILATNPPPARFHDGAEQLFSWHTTARHYAAIFETLRAVG